MTGESNTPSVPYYQDDWATIYHGDCRDVLPGLVSRNTFTLTDLPYGIGLDYGESFEDTPDYLEELVHEALPLMRLVSPVVAFTCGIANVWRYPAPTWMLCWYQANAMGGSGYWGFNVWQPILCYGPDPYLTLGMGRRPDFINTAAPNNGADKRNGHPCPKPIEAWSKVLVRVSPDQSRTILDPFMGSGSTLVAAKYSGRRSIGIEIEERFCEIAANRLAQEVMELAV